MAGRGLEQVVRYLNLTAAVQQNGKLADAELLERFIRQRDSAAFEVLVWRYGSMVMNVCQRVTRCEQDAEDGFQATFMTFARKAQSIGHGGSVSSWLYKVAFRTALELKRRAPQVLLNHEPSIPCAAGPLEETIGRELQHVLDEEVVHLPEKYRTPFILSCFQGKTNREIADQLRCPEATVRTRLARGRERLRSRLNRRGMTVTASALAIALSPPMTRAAKTALVSSTIDLSLGWNSVGNGASNAIWIAKKVQHIMFLQMIKQCAAVVVLVAGLGGLMAFSVHQVLAAKPYAGEQQEPAKRAEKKEGPIAEDHKAIVGTWETSLTTVQTTKSPGKVSVSKEVEVTVRWAITPDKILVIGEDGFLDEEYDYKIDPEKQPKTIDITSRRDGASAGIYQLEGNSLKINLGYKTERPAEFGNRSPVYRRISLEPAKVSQRYSSAPGCFWMIEPRSPPPMMATLGITYIYDSDKDGAAVVVLAYALPETRKKPLFAFRPVVLDAAKRRYLPQAETGGSSAAPEGPSVSMQRWRIDPKILPADKVAKIGIEAMTSESKRLIALDAKEQAKQAGIEVLPWPELGTEYPLALTTIDGRMLSREDFRGKVVLVDCWASWCGPCMGMMPALKEVYEKWHKDGLEIVGINLDQDVNVLRATCMKQGLSWPQVLAPTDPKAREIWQQAAGIESLPCIFLIDREGKLRANMPDDLEIEIGNLMRK